MTDPHMPVGDTLVGVHYELLSWESEPSVADQVDQVSMALSLDWRRGSATRVSWSSNVELEGLALGGPGLTDPSAELRIVDVSSRWGSLIGAKLEACGFSHAQPPAELPWAMNLTFGTGGHLVIALGEILPRGLSYIPDCLLVTASREVAQGFAPRTAVGSAWADLSE